MNKVSITAGASDGAKKSVDKKKSSVVEMTSGNGVSNLVSVRFDQSIEGM